ncbi:MAG: hypothetical protein H6700_00675 [Myxococcales bacterium]|nr:hypothetical protein [Myxococcales bacterium]
MSQPRKTQALSLLEGILDETASEAEAARKKLDEELAAKEAAARAEAEAAELARREEIARRLAEEEARRSAAAERRTATLEALRIEDLKAKGLWKEPEPAPAPVAAAAPVTTGPAQDTRAAVAVQQKSALGRNLAAAAAVLVIGGGAAGAWYVQQQSLVDTVQTFSAAAPSTVDTQRNLVATLTFQAIPDPIVRAPEAASGPASASGTPARRRPPRTGGAATTAPTSGPRPSLTLGGSLGGH